MSTKIPRVAYLNTEYPSLSHTFIEREIRSVRESGVEVDTFSVRRPGGAGAMGSAHARAADETFYLLDGLWSFAADQVWGISRHPIRYLISLFSAQRMAPPGIRARVLHVVYAMEGVRLMREMCRRGLKHVHVDMANNGAAVAKLACEFRKEATYSLTVHGSAVFFNVEQNRLAEKVRHTVFTRCISDFCRAQVQIWVEPEVWKRIHVVHCGVDPDVFIPRAREPSETLVLLTVGRLAAVKGYEVLLEACRMLSDSGLEWRLEMVGDGPRRRGLAKMADDLGIAERVVFHGPVSQDEIQTLYESADVFVVSSFMEGVPVVLMEAMAKEVTVVCTQVGGASELVEHGVNGWFVRPASATDLAERLKAVASDREALSGMGTAGRDKVIREFSHPSVGFQMAALFRKYLGS